MEELVTEIKKNGYWMVQIRPSSSGISGNRISSKEECEAILQKAQLNTGRIQYPNIDPREGIFISGSDSVGSTLNYVEFGSLEFWRLYQNGLFVHYFTMPEDYRMTDKEKNLANSQNRFAPENIKIDRFFSILEAIYLLTEIFIFASRLAKEANYGEEVEIIIELGNTKNRALFFWGEFFRSLHNTYYCRYEPLTKTLVVKTQDLINDAPGKALDFAIDIFKEYNWKNANRTVFQGDQEKFLKENGIIL